MLTVPSDTIKLIKDSEDAWTSRPVRIVDVPGGAAEPGGHVAGQSGSGEKMSMLSK